MSSLYGHEVTILSLHPVPKFFGCCCCAFDCCVSPVTRPTPDYCRCCFNCNYSAIIESRGEQSLADYDRRPRSAVPKDLEGIYSSAQWRSLVRRLDCVMQPLMTPCCAEACLVCWLPIACFASLCHCNCIPACEKWRIEQIVATQNARLEPEGMRWTLKAIRRHGLDLGGEAVDENSVGACWGVSDTIELALKFDLEARERFEAAHSSESGTRKLAGDLRAQDKLKADLLQLQQRKAEDEQAARLNKIRADADAARRAAQLAAEAESTKLTLAFLRAMEIRDATARAAADPRQGRDGQQSMRFNSLGPAPPVEAMYMPPPPAYEDGPASSSAFSAAAFLDHCDKYGAPSSPYEYHAAAAAAAAPVSAQSRIGVGGLQLVQVRSAAPMGESFTSPPADSESASWALPSKLHPSTDVNAAAEGAYAGSSPTIARMPAHTAQ